ncbi:MAG TPA: hypothetical protein VE967_13900, partial [Gemmatimonadaceae bacterium]|nr:hypothetical protein [Gemmatimonadaceae bacterium]
MDTSSPESAAAPARAASILHLVSPDAAQLARIAAPFLSGSGELRTLVLTADDESAVQVVHILVNNVSGTLAIVALTGAARAKRVLGTGVPPAAAMSLPTAAALIAQSALPLGEVRQLIVAMPRDPSSLAALDTVMAELPKGASRVLVAARETPEVEALVERHFFKTRRIREDRARVPESFYGEISVVGTAPAALWTTLRSLLEENDPPSCVVVAENEQSLADARRTLSALGYREDSHIVAAAAPPPEAVSLVVFAGLPSAAHVASAIAAAPASIVFLCAPREIESVRALVAPLVVRSRMLDGVRARAASREAATRGKLREILASGEFVAELSVIAPLL